MMTIDDYRNRAEQCRAIASGTGDNRVAAALLAYACELEQRARLIEIGRKAAKSS